MSRWVRLMCSEEAEELQKRYPAAFLLLCQIARRARWKSCPITKLMAGEAFIGDWKDAGLRTEMQYRHAKKTLEKAGLVTFRGTNKGTIATITNTMIFSISPEADNGPGNTPGTIQQRTNNDPATTNHTDIRKNGNTDTTSFAPNGTRSGPKPPKQSDIQWSPEEGFAGITPNDHSRWEVAYPAVDLHRQIAAAGEWLRGNPAKRKKNVRRFLTSWFNRAQERGGDISSKQPQQTKHSGAFSI
jgi:hypothetical protein